MSQVRTLWSREKDTDERMIAYTVGDDRVYDARLLRWDVIGSLCHLAGLEASKLLSGREAARLRAGLRAAYQAVARGRLRIGPEHEDVHSAVEAWLTKRLGDTGERIHTARSRNDQVACDLRLYLKDRILALHDQALGVADELLRFAAAHRTALWPGYTHQRRAMPSSAGLWAGALAEGLLDTAEAAPGLYAAVDKSPLGSAAGYGVPLPLNRGVAAKALGFAGLVANVAAVQNGRGKLEAAVLFWCSQVGHDLSRLSADVILLSSEEFGLIRLPARFATGSSIMPQKRNPDLFELTRARAALLDGDLGQIMNLKAKLTSGYHRDFQLLKEPLFHGLDRTEEMLGMMAVVVPALEVDRARGVSLLEGGVLATDLVMKMVEEGTPFRSAYREVAAWVKSGGPIPKVAPALLIARRRSEGGVGRLLLTEAGARLRAGRRWSARARGRFDAAVRLLLRGR